MNKADRDLLALMADEENPYSWVYYVPGRWHETNSAGRTRWSYQRYQPARYGFKSFVRVTAPVKRLVAAGLVDHESENPEKRCRVKVTEAGRQWLMAWRADEAAKATRKVRANARKLIQQARNTPGGKRR